MGTLTLARLHQSFFGKLLPSLQKFGIKMAAEGTFSPYQFSHQKDSETIFASVEFTCIAN